MANKVLIKKSSVSGKIPLATDLDMGELAVNVTDIKLYTKDSSNTVISLSGATMTEVIDNAIAMAIALG
jgi:hypothetical protein